MDAKVLETMRKAASDGYIHALEFVHGSPVKDAIVAYDEDSFFGVRKPGEKAEDAHRRWASTSEALSFYMSTAKPSKNSIDRLPKLIAEKWEENRGALEKPLRDGLEIPEGAVSIAVSLDGVLAPRE